MSDDELARLDDDLRSLGKTADEVAQSLRTRGIKGARRESCDCPIAHYLRLRLSGHRRKVKVECHFYRVILGGGGKLPRRELPGAIISFVARFDAGAYPDLVQDSNMEAVLS